jgi:hypothetical protein
VLVFRRVLDAAAAQTPALLSSTDPVPVYTPVLGAAQAPAGVAPAIGPANPSLAAE